MSKQLDVNSSSAKRPFGSIPYMDPKKLDKSKYKLNKKSDVYSFGVLMWQISSGRQPFCSKNDADSSVHSTIDLTMKILNGLREEEIYGTPIEYSNLYKGVVLI